MLMKSNRLLSIGTCVLITMVTGALHAEPFPWQQDYARVMPSGDLQYAPKPFEFVAGDSLRYIDFENGDDTNPGSRDEPWKHHPWDPAATGKADAAGEEIHTYIFRGGVTYRGAFEVPPTARGTVDNPIRLTRDPSWGEGPAVINGAKIVTNWEKDRHPKMAEDQTIWATDVDFLPRTLWLTKAGQEPVRVKLARWPNWEESNPRDLMSEWPTWDQPEWWTDKNQMEVDGTDKHVGIAESLPRPLEDLVGGTVWTEWGIVMGSPYPAEIEAVNEELGGIAFRGPWTYHDNEKIITGNRYHLEDLPQFLDEPGEFWVEKTGGNRGRLYVRFPNDAAPADFIVEAGKTYNFFEGTHFEHIHWTGLTFRFGNVRWNYNHPRWAHDQTIAAIRLSGSGDGIVIAHNAFENLPMPIRIQVGKPDQRIGNVSITDNSMRQTDHGGAYVENAIPRKADDMGELGHVDLLRNKFEDIGMRIISGEHGHAVDIRYPETSHMAGNFLNRIAGWGLAVFGGKPSGRKALTVDLSRHLVHHNRVEDVLLKSNDWGGIETWQGGSHYVFDNVVINALGYKNWRAGKDSDTTSFGHAYYADGSFKNYMFNNIGLGENNELNTKYQNVTAIQNIISFENWYFNNSFHKFAEATRQQAPAAGRRYFLGNVFSDVTKLLFRHANPKDVEPDPNASHYSQASDFFYDTIAYAGNVIYQLTGRLGTFEETGLVYDGIDGFSEALGKVDAMATEVGIVTDEPPLVDPEAMQWEPAPKSVVKEIDMQVFVPWAVARTVGEWQFALKPKNPSEITDESWFMTEEYHQRGSYYKDRSRSPLFGVEIDASNYVESPLANWTKSALQLNGSDEYLRAAAPESDKAWTLNIRESNVMIEAHLKTNDSNGGLVSKMSDGVGYELRFEEGALIFRVGTDADKTVAVTMTQDQLPKDQWLHLLAELDRANGKINLYLNGTEVLSTIDLPEDFSGSLANDADFLVGGGPEKEHLAATIDFLRVSASSLAESKTTSDELHSWTVDGPQYRDFAGNDRRKQNAAGALVQ